MTTSGSSTAPDDWSQAQDLAAEMPEKLAELQQLWLDEARKYNVLPLDDRRIERFNADLVGRPVLVRATRSCSSAAWAGSPRTRDQHQEQVPRRYSRGRRPRRRRPGSDRLPGWRLRRLEPLRERGEADVLLQPARSATLQGRRRLADPAGTHQIRMEFAYDGGGLAKGGTVSLYVDGNKVGEGRVEAPCR